MSDKKHIDRLFQEGLKDFEVKPSDAVWKNIESELNKKKKKRRIIPIWWRYVGVAALITVLLTIGSLFLNDKNETPTHQVVDSKNADDNDLKIENDKIGSIVTTKKNDKDSLDNKAKINHEDAMTSKQSIIAKTPTSGNESNMVLPSKGKQDLNITIINQKKSGNNAYVSNKDDYSSSPKNSTQNTRRTISSSTVTKNSKSKHKNNHKILSPLRQTETTHNTLNNTQENNTVANSTSSKEEKNKNKTLYPSKNTQVASANNKKNRTLNKDTSTQIKNITIDNENNTAVVKNETKENGPSIEDELEENKVLIKDKDQKSKWAITPNAAPVYFNTLGEGSSIDPQFKSNSKQGEVNISYGISASYAINNRFSIRSGINKINLGYNINDVVVFQSTNSAFGVNRPSLQNVNNASNDVIILSTESISDNTRAPEFIRTSNLSINQTLGYIEVPLELQYKILDKKVGIHVIGGFSSFFLSENDVFSETQDGGKTFLGKATNVNDISYSANLGIGLDYQVSKSIDLNLEPIFKYQFNTFNNTTGNVTPFIIGVYTGFAIKF